MHVHSCFSTETIPGVEGVFFSPRETPEEIYRRAKAAGMDFVTITDHDTIDGCLDFVARNPGARDFVVGEEVSRQAAGEPPDGAPQRVRPHAAAARRAPAAPGRRLPGCGVLPETGPVLRLEPPCSTGRTSPHSRRRSSCGWWTRSPRSRCATGAACRSSTSSPRSSPCGGTRRPRAVATPIPATWARCTRPCPAMIWTGSSPASWRGGAAWSATTPRGATSSCTTTSSERGTRWRGMPPARDPSRGACGCGRWEGSPARSRRRRCAATSAASGSWRGWPSPKLSLFGNLERTLLEAA